MEEEEDVGALCRVLLIELLRCLRGSTRTSSASEARISAGASVKSVSRAKCRFSSRLARYRTSSPSSRSLTPAGLESIVGTTTIVRLSAGMPSLKSSRGRRRAATSSVTSQLATPTPRWVAQRTRGAAKQTTTKAGRHATTAKDAARLRGTPPWPPPSRRRCRVRREATAGRCRTVGPHATGSRAWPPEPPGPAARDRSSSSRRAPSERASCPRAVSADARAMRMASLATLCSSHVLRLAISSIPWR